MTRVHFGIWPNDLSGVRSAISEDCDPNVFGPQQCGWASLQGSSTANHELLLHLLQSGSRNPNLQGDLNSISHQPLATNNNVQVADGGAKIPVKNAEDSNESYCLAGPGEIKMSFDFNRQHPSLKIRVWEIRDLKLPKAHNFSHLYVKCYLLPDKHKETKRKTSLVRIDEASSDSFSSHSSTSSESSVMSDGSINGKLKLTNRVRAAFRKRPRLPSRRQKDQVKCVVQSNEGAAFGRISAFFDEVLSYDSLALHKVKMAETKVNISICGYNRWTYKGQQLAEISIPLAVGKKQLMPEWFPVSYKIEIASASIGQETKMSQMNQSWELKEGGMYTGRSLAWNSGMLLASTSDVSSSAIVSGDTTDFKPPLPTGSSIKRSRRRSSKAARFFKSEKNYRDNSGSEDISIRESSVTADDGKQEDTCDDVEFIGQDIRDSASNLSTSNRTVDQPLVYQNSRYTQDVNLSCVRNYEKETEVQTMRNPQDMQDSSTDDPVVCRPLLKYSRAFGESSRSSAKNRWFSEADVAIEDIEEDYSPFGVQESVQTSRRRCTTQR